LADPTTITPDTPFFLKPFELIGGAVMAMADVAVDLLQYFSDTFQTLVSTRLRIHETVQQFYSIGYKSAPIILFCVGSAAAVTIIEYSFHMKLVLNSASLVPGFAALLVLRELGAVITALLLTSRVGAGIAAEVGSMQITEQIDALRLLNVDPYRYLVIPRLVACTFASMTLCIFANATCLLSAMIASSTYLNFSAHAFVSQTNHFASFKDFYLSIIKGAIFGAVIPLVSCYYGFHCKPGAEGVGRATTNAVVTNAVAIIILDFILTYLFSYLY
jgi:phospholipid/cholesterol/gamma-HCH transport system permease protein